MLPYSFGLVCTALLALLLPGQYSDAAPGFGDRLAPRVKQVDLLQASPTANNPIHAISQPRRTARSESAWSNYRSNYPAGYYRVRRTRKIPVVVEYETPGFDLDTPSDESFQVVENREALVIVPAPDLSREGRARAMALHAAVCIGIHTM